MSVVHSDDRPGDDLALAVGADCFVAGPHGLRVLSFRERPLPA